MVIYYDPAEGTSTYVGEATPCCEQCPFNPFRDDFTDSLNETADEFRDALEGLGNE